MASKAAWMNCLSASGIVMMPSLSVRLEERPLRRLVEHARLLNLVIPLEPSERRPRLGVDLAAARARVIPEVLQPHLRARDGSDVGQTAELHRILALRARPIVAEPQDDPRRLR